MLRTHRPARHPLMVVVVLAALLTTALVTTGCGGPEVPDVVGMKPADAVRALQDAGFKLGEVIYVASDEVDLGTVAKQEPASGEQADEGSAVDLALNYSKGLTVIVPDVIGMNAAQAEEVATSLGLVPKKEEQPSTTTEKGLVASQVPSADSVVGRGDVMVLVISSGPAPEKVAVPGVVGKTQADAEKAIKNAGLKPVVHSNYSSTVAKGSVAAQIPDPGASLVKGANVDILVSLGKGVGAAAVPNVVGKKEADAVSAIKSAGLVAGVYRQYSETVAVGIVSAQVPDGGTTAAAGSQVAIVVSLGKEPAGGVAVPNVIGKTQAEAEAAIQAVGLSATVTESASATATVGSVFSQLPVAGSTAPAGSPVLLVVSTGP